MVTALVHRLTDDEGRQITIGDHSFLTLPRIGETVVVDDDGVDAFLKVVDVVHVAAFEPSIKRAAYGWPQSATHIYGTLLNGRHDDPILARRSEIDDA